MPRALSLIAILLLTAVLCIAQTAAGGLTGVVVDSTGAVIAGAMVEVVNTGTGEKRTVTTNEDGIYTVPNIEPGLYNVTVTADGFATGAAKEVKISVSFVTSLRIELKPGDSANEIIDIVASDEQTQVNTTDQQLSTLIDNKRILQLPLLSRDPNVLILLSPGVFPANSDLGGFSVNGSRERNNNFQVDGVDNNDTEVPGIPGGITTPNIDATQEFRVITNNFNAEYGRNSGAVINVQTKGGTNEYHGGVYLYNRNDAFSARDFFDTTGEPDPLKRNQFGASIGGPILKDRLFFFGNYEGDRFIQGFSVSRAVPSAAARMGILPNTPFGTLDIRQSGLNNPFQLPFNNAVIDLINAIYPLGNDPALAPLPGVFDAFTFSSSFRSRADEFTTRIDYQLNNNNRLTARFGFNRNDLRNLSPETFPGFDDGLSSLQRSSLFAISLTTIITPNLVNEVRFGFNRLNAPFSGQGDGGVSTKLDDTIKAAFAANGVAVNGPRFGGANGQALNLGIAGITSLFNNDTQRRFTGTTTLADTISYIRGSHSFKAGVESRFVYSNSDTNFGRSEFLSFNFPSLFDFAVIVDNNGNDIPTVGLGGDLNDYASFLYGLVGRQTQTQFFDKSGARSDSNFRGFRVREIDGFIQDTWRVRPNFTLNYGVRYEFKGVPYEVNGQLSTLVDQDPSFFTPGQGFVFQLVGKNSPNENLQLYDDDYNNIAPRFGFAWDPFKNGKTSIRGGYGVFYDRVFGNLFTNARGNLPFEVTFDIFPAMIDQELAFLENLPRVPTQRTRFAAFDEEFLFPVLFPNKGKGGANNAFKEDFRSPYSQNFNLGLQRQLLSGLLLEVDYVGAKGTNLLRVIDGSRTSVRRVNALTGSRNPISPNAIQNILNGLTNTAFFQSALNLAAGFSTYHGLTLRLTKTLTNEKYGVGQIQGAYTYSHAIDNAGDPLVSTNGDRSFPRDSSGFEGGFGAAERGNSGNDTRHRFVMNFIYDLPFKFQNRIVNRLLGGWSMSGIVQAQSGNPFSIFYDIDTQGTGLGARARFANGVKPLPLPTGVNPRLQTGPSPALFRDPFIRLANGGLAVDRSILNGQGDVARNSFVGPGFVRADYTLQKRIQVRERQEFIVRADFFNLFNRVNLGQPVNIVTDPQFGQSLSAGLPRIVQFVVRYNF